MRFIGIDVGLKGAVAYVDVDSGEPSGYRTFEMPTFREKRGKSTKTHLDENLLCALLNRITKNKECITYLEKQQPMPKQGLVSTFGLGVQYGIIRGILSALKIPYQVMRSQHWQKEYSIVRAKNTKHASYRQASTLFPKASLVTERGRIKDGCADAILMAEFIKRKWKRWGTLTKEV